MTTTLDGGAGSLSPAQLAERLLRLERARRKMAMAESALLNEVVAGGTAAEFGCRDAKTYVANLLNIPPGEAQSRLRLAEAVGRRRHPFTGEDLGPAHPVAAAALADAAISARSAASIAAAIDKLPAEVADEYPATEAVLVGYAREHHAELVARHAHDVCQALDQDGSLREAERRERDRGTRLHRRPDGSGRLEADLTAEAAELVDVLFDAAAAPAPADDGTADLRTPTQRRHDALLTGLKLLLGSGRLPTSGGCRTTVILTADAGDFARNEGAARTGHGYAVPVEVAKNWLEPEARAILVLLSKTKGIEAYSTTQRCFTEQQRLAMAARDRGCSYWGCDAPAAWTQAHHVTDWQHTHTTSVDDGALVCGADHRAFEQMGWRSIMLNGRPHWIPPAWLDPDQTPRTNHQHD